MHQVLRFLFMGICLAASSSVFASGFYVGAGGGYQHVKIDGFSISLPPLGEIKLPDIKGKGGVGLIYTGYEFAGDVFALSFEANVQPTNIDIGPAYAPGLIKFKNSWGVNARPGIYLTPNIKAFGAIGWQQAFLEEGNHADSSSQLKGRDRIGGLYFGGGVEFTVPVGVDADNHLGFRVEYAHVDYGLSTLLSHTKTDAVLGSIFWRFG
ncbi:MAG: outer membrane beta-barrel protein [Legionellales bacterium]|nr:outer membrane beta-barrel protein [Legionellales bacterium]